LNASSHFDSYRVIPDFTPRLPDLSRQESQDETTDLCHDAHVTSFQVAPEATVQCSVVVLEATDEADESWLTNDRANLYLWLIRTDDVKICLENGILGQSTERGRLSHTNLSGNVPAHCGGELWFRDAESIYLNGGSSRFTARSSSELEAIVEGFRAAGYKVCSFGWNEELGKPKRTLRKAEIKWL
jgi:hypothetical protein